MAIDLSGVYVITAAALRPGRTHVDVARAAVEAGARFVQLRDKLASTRELYEQARAIRAISAGTETLFIVNDRIDVSLAAGADGAHVGPDDLPWPEARRLLGPDRLLGVSAATPAEVQEAEAAGVDYLGVGPAYATGSKSDAGVAIGAAGIARIAALTPLPVIAIGGITVEHVAPLRAAGARGIAVVAAVAGADDPIEAARALARAWSR